MLLYEFKKVKIHLVFVKKYVTTSVIFFNAKVFYKMIRFMALLAVEDKTLVIR